MAKKGIKKAIPYVALVLVIAGLLTFVLWPQAPVDKPTVTTTNSYVHIIDHTSGENVDDLCPVEIYGNKLPITSNEERYDITYYEKAVSECMPEKVKEDLSMYTDIIIRVNPDEATDGYWTVYDYLYPNAETNYVYTLYAFHEATDIFGNCLDQDAGDVWDGLTANCTIPAWFPTYTTTERHQGTDWDIYEDIEDLSATTLAKLNNEKYWRNMPTLFSLADDTADHDKSGDYKMITETCAIEIDFNDTISTVDGNDKQVNLTSTDCIYDHFIEYGVGSDTDKIYFVFTETWDCFSTNLEFNFKIQLAVNITGATVKIGRIVIPDRNFVGYTFTSLQTLLTVA